MRVLLCALLVTSFPNVLGVTYSGMIDMERLTSDLLKNYSVSTPAFTDIYDNTTMTLDMSLVAILDIDEVQQTFSFSAHIGITWEDARLRWNSSAYGDIESIQLRVEYIWFPAFYLLNPADSSTNLNTDLPVYVDDAGFVALRIYTIFKTTCSLDTRRYPFDTQSCDILLTCPRGTVSRLVVNEPKVIAEKLMSMASEWNLYSIGGEVVNRGHNAEIDIGRFTVVMTRKSVCYITSTIFPMFLLSFLTSFVFLFPPDSGEKLSYVISIFVSYAVFLNFINDAMPRTSTFISNLEGYLIGVLLHCVTAILASLVCARRAFGGSDAPLAEKPDISCCGLKKVDQGCPGHEKKMLSANQLNRRDWIFFGCYVTSAFLLLGMFTL
ncbi:acetylcholine receptor subunit beta-type unc-29-like [Gigantopelta aegis]|uniref:acetylcholine receptor subunit beta-type unc-29-like n=1 Tax=Gigantopelta aegis TaxID=1735272 RepID=UPI001B88B3A9|nr:acetylcholine receptor subunit beta-type unc-29-like [Gigantopelta aegis]